MQLDPLSLVGTTISDKYLLESVVGEGGFAVVYRATHTVWKRPVAIKVFKALGDVSPSRRQQLLDDFVREGTLLAELSERSSAIVQARDIGTLTLRQGDEVPFMVLEWLDGETLEAVIYREANLGVAPRSIEAAVHLLGPVAEALALAHQLGIAHRDVKPGNVFVVGDVDGDFTVKLLDFGIAKVAQEAEKDAFRKTSGQSSFTPLYAAPEQFNRTGGTGPWTDVFALALVLVEVLLGREALVGDNVVQLAVAAADVNRRPSPRSLGVEVSDEVEEVFLKALAVAPEDRYQDVGEFWVALRLALELGAPSGFTLASAQLRRVAPVSSVRGPLGAGPLSSARPPSVRGGPPRGSTDKTTPSVQIAIGTAATAVMPEPPVSSHQAAPAPSTSEPAPVAPALASTTSPPVEAPKGPKRGGLLALGGVALVAALVVGGVVARGRAGAGAGAGAQTAPQASSAAPSTSAAATPVPPPPACPKEMLEVPGGEFYMGSDEKDEKKAGSDERPAHPVKVGRYCMDEFEVTAGEFKACSDLGKCKRATPTNDWDGITARQHKLYDPICNATDYTGRAAHPMNCVDWQAAQTFCEEMRGGRLPTEAEWEFAARGSDGRIYPWGDAPPAPGLLNACGSECVTWGRQNPDPPNVLAPMYRSDDGFAHTSPVGSFPRGKTSHGMKDMVGNVGEWVGDFYAAYAAGPKLLDPKGPTKGEERVIRGGGWNAGNPVWLRPTFRFSSPPALRSHGIGFRCAKGL